MSGEGQTSEGQCAIGGMQDDVKGGKTAGGASIQNKEHNTPPSPTGATCSGQRRPMPGKLAALHHRERPQTISELRSFMGFCNYYSGYV